MKQQQQQKRHLNPMLRSQRKMRKLEDLSRREEASEGEKQRLKDLSKQIKNASGTREVQKIQEEIQRILEDFKGIRNIPGIKSARRGILITKIENEKGEVITSRKEIANVFGEVHKKLCDDQEHEETEQEHE